MSAVADKLREARALIERKGWTQGAFENLDGSCCALGAIEAVTGEFYGDTDLVDKLLEAIGMVGDDPYVIAIWNDTEGRTPTEVLAAFDRAIELAERDQ